MKTELDLPIFDYETDERSSVGKKSDRVRGTGEGGFLGVAVEIFKEAPPSAENFGHRKRASKCAAFVRKTRRSGGSNPLSAPRKKHLRKQVLFSTKFALRASEIASL